MTPEMYGGLMCVIAVACIAKAKDTGASVMWLLAGGLALFEGIKIGGW